MGWWVVAGCWFVCDCGYGFLDGSWCCIVCVLLLFISLTLELLYWFLCIDDCDNVSGLAMLCLLVVVYCLLLWF